MSRSRAFCFTHNNYETTQLEDSLECLYIIYGKETGESGTPHLQGFVYFKSAKTLSAVIKLMKPLHVEKAITIEEAIEYCKKDGDFTERGEPPMSQKEKGNCNKRRWDEAYTAAQEGRVDDIPSDIRFKYDTNIKRIRNDYIQKLKLPDTETQHLWYYGGTGTGKSRKARTDHPDAYLKTVNKWWCGYTNEDTVIIEDFDKRHECLAYHLKIWGDRYPFPAEVKGSKLVIRPKLIIITSNYHPREIWDSVGDLEPIERRFKCVRFTKSPIN